jgi:tetratricopeptide (TPR) repeat protein
MLAISKNSYIFQDNTDSRFEKAMTNIKLGIQAFETAKEKLSIRKLLQAFAALPKHDKSLSISADIVESLLQMKAYDDAIAVAEDIESHISTQFCSSKSDYFNIMRVYSNLAEAHSENHQPDLARRYYQKTLDHIFASEQEPDVELVNILLNRLDQY